VVEMSEDRRNGDRRGRGGTGWATRLVEYLLVVLVAIIVSMGIIYFFLRPPGPCLDCQISTREVRAECEKMFGFGSETRAAQMPEEAEDEYLMVYSEQAADPNAGFSSPSGYSSASSSTSVSAAKGPGYVLVRARPQSGRDYTGGQTTYGSSDTSEIAPETLWQEVTVIVARYVNPLRNDVICPETSLHYRENGFEAYCELPNHFEPDDNGHLSYRIFVRNASRVPIEYCIVTNCDFSAPFGSGKLCQLERGQTQY